MPVPDDMLILRLIASPSSKLTGSMAQLVSIVPTLMWLQHRFGHSSLGNDENPPTQKTIEFSPNHNLRGTGLDTSITQSLTDVEASAGSVTNKDESLILESKDVLHPR